MNERQFKDGQHKKMWQQIRQIRREAAGRGDYGAADFMELLELVASGTRIGKVSDHIKRIMAQPLLYFGDRHK